jgi:broad specificity phosphatase PhoE
LTCAEIEAGSPGSIAAWQGGELDRPGGGETIAEFSDRVGEALNDLGLNQAGKTVLVCAHGGVVRYLDRIAGRPRPGPAAHLNGYWVNVRPPSIAVGQGFSPGRALESVTWQYR